MNIRHRLKHLGLFIQNIILVKTSPQREISDEVITLAYGILIHFKFFSSSAYWFQLSGTL